MASPNPAWCNPARQDVISHRHRFARCGSTYVVWTEQYLWNRKALIAHVKDLFPINRQAVRLAYVTLPISRKVGEYIFLDDRITALISPGCC